MDKIVSKIIFPLVFLVVLLAFALPVASRAQAGEDRLFTLEKVRAEGGRDAFIIGVTVDTRGYLEFQPTVGAPTRKTDSVGSSIDVDAHRTTCFQWRAHSVYDVEDNGGGRDVRVTYGIREGSVAQPAVLGIFGLAGLGIARGRRQK